jgi:beta-N-acetylglucosaminidase
LKDNSPNTNLSEDEIEQILLSKGLISEIPQHLLDAEEETYKPIKVKGQPLSEAILEERN